MKVLPKGISPYELLPPGCSAVVPVHRTVDSLPVLSSANAEFLGFCRSMADSAFRTFVDPARGNSLVPSHQRLSNHSSPVDVGSAFCLRRCGDRIASTDREYSLP